MSSTLNEEQVDDLLEYIGAHNPNIWKRGEKLACCPIHGESRPSMGVSIDKQVFHCFSCGEAGDFSWLLFKSMPDQFKNVRQARLFLKDRYELEYKELNLEKVTSIKRYEEQQEYFMGEYEDDIEGPKISNRVVQPMYKLAPFMSGKETYKYFFNRGFTKEDMKEYMIGRDLVSKTVTIPAFYKDGKLAGVIGRYISSNRKHNERYKIYDFKKGSVLYPIDKYESTDGTMILVEGMFDCMYMRKCGYKNTQAIMGLELTEEQIEIIENECDTVIYLGDNDKRGREGLEYNRKLLKNKVKFLVVDYPSEGKDPCDWSKKQIDRMINGAHSVTTRKIKRID